jgi:hypothetical protein
MRVISIFLYFLVCLTMAIHLGDWKASLIVMGLFLPFFDMAERYDHT